GLVILLAGLVEPPRQRVREDAALLGADALGGHIVGAAAALVVDVGAEPGPVLAEPPVGEAALVEPRHPVVRPLAVERGRDARGTVRVDPVARVGLAPGGEHGGPVLEREYAHARPAARRLLERLADGRRQQPLRRAGLAPLLLARDRRHRLVAVGRRAVNAAV